MLALADNSASISATAMSINGFNYARLNKRSTISSRRAFSDSDRIRMLVVAAMSLKDVEIFNLYLTLSSNRRFTKKNKTYLNMNI
jgi:hypothetical protein